MVTRLLAIQAVNADAADALAIAIAAGHDGGDPEGDATSAGTGSGLDRAIEAALARDARTAPDRTGGE